MSDLTITAVTEASGYPTPRFGFTALARAALSIGDVLRLSNGYWKCSASDSSAAMATKVSTAVVPLGGAISPIHDGFAEITGPTLVPGGLYVVSRTAGKTMPYADLQNGDTFGFVGIAKTANIMYLNPAPVGIDLLFDGASPTPTGALSGNVAQIGAVGTNGTLSVRPTTDVSQGDLLWLEGRGEPNPARKLSSSSTINGEEVKVGIATTDIASGEVGLAYHGYYLTFSNSTIIRGHVYIAGATGGTIVPYTDVQNGWKVRIVGIGWTDNSLMAGAYSMGETLNETFTYQA